MQALSPRDTFPKDEEAEYEGLAWIDDDLTGPASSELGAEVRDVCHSPGLCQPGRSVVSISDSGTGSCQNFLRA